jgi:hypothetical protein
VLGSVIERSGASSSRPCRVPVSPPTFCLAILAGELLTLARLFDRVEVSLRRVGWWIMALWVGSPKTARTLIVLAIPACTAALAYLIF